MTPTYPFSHKAIDRAARLPHFSFEANENPETEELIDAALRDEHGILAEFLWGRDCLPKG
jgi:hypothetical protein